MNIKRGFTNDGNRYEFDFNYCSLSKGWAQVDTGQDASYFGDWAHPTKLQIISFAEGDVTITTCVNINEFKEEIAKMFEFYNDCKIDIGDEENAIAWASLGYAPDEYCCIYKENE